LFLDLVAKLSVINNSNSIIFSRKQFVLSDSGSSGDEIIIHSQSLTDGNETISKARYLQWTREIGGGSQKSETETIVNAVRDLPGKWPKIREATIALAILIGVADFPGNLNIYFPADVHSGSSAHLSASFFVDMSRTFVDFSQNINQLLMKHLAMLAVDAVVESLMHYGVKPLQSSISCLPLDGGSGDRWWKSILEAITRRGLNLKDLHICLSDSG